MKAKLVVQVKLRAPIDGGFSERTCFIDNAKVRVGSKVTLTNSEDPKRRWEVVWVGEELDFLDINQGWHAGGL